MLIKSAYQEGYKASTSGIELIQCPYPNGIMRTSWLAGWYSGRRNDQILTQYLTTGTNN